MRTKEEIKIQIEGLNHTRKNLPEYNYFGDNNWSYIDAQIDILKGASLEDYEDTEEYDAADEADQWLQGSFDEDLFE